MSGIQTVRPSRLLGGATRRLQGINSKPEDLRILGSEFRATVSDAILDPGITLTRSIDEASYLTIPLEDSEGELRASKLLQAAFTLELDGLRFRHAGVDRDEDGTLTLRPRALSVAKLMGKTGPVKVERGTWTRAEFIYSLVKEVRPRIPFFCPELHTTQPIASERQAREDDAERLVRRDRGLDTGADLTVKGEDATSEQIANGDTVLRTGESLDAPRAAMVASIITGIAEQLMRNVAGGLGSSNGYFQILAMHNLNWQDLAAMARIYFTEGFTGAGGAIELANQGLSPAAISAAVQGNQAGAASYSPWVSEAEEWVDAFGGGTLKGDSSTSVTRSKGYSFERKANEDTWACMKRLGDEVNWRRFEANGVVYYIAEPDLLGSKVRMRVSEEAAGIDGISWSQDSRRRVQELSVTCRAKAWAAPPGTVAVVSGEGQADGRYIVTQIESVLGDETATITLSRPTKPLPEPAAETVTKSVGGSRGGVVTAEDGPESFQAMLEEAERIDKLNLTYVFGGGHGSTPAPANGPFDCSSFVSRILQVGGFDIQTQATGTLISFGAEGGGELVTVYVRNGGPGGGHTLIQLGDRYFGTSSSNPGGGPGELSEGSRSSSYLAGFTKRHPPGL